MGENSLLAGNMKLFADKIKIDISKKESERAGHKPDELAAANEWLAHDGNIKVETAFN